MSLERLVKEFAERVRAELLARIEAEKNSDTAVVKWQGFDNDGKPIVKNLDKIETAEGLGNVAQKKGTKLIYDKNSSVEYRKRKKTKPELIKKQDIPLAVRERRISRAPLLTPDLFQVISNLFDVPKTAFYMVTYSTHMPGPGWSGGRLPIGAGQSETTYTSTSESVSNYTEEATQGVTYRISCGAAAVACQNFFLGPGFATASVNGLGLNLSLDITSANGSDEQCDIAINIEQTTTGGTIDQEVTASILSSPGSSTQYRTGDAEVRSDWAFLSFPRAVYYFQTPENITTGNNEIREIDLNTIVPNRIYDSRIVHNYASREGDDVFVYTIYQAVDVDMSQEYQVYLTNTTRVKDDERYLGKVTKYIIHTRLNLLTGEYEHKINESPNTGNANAVTGQLDEYDATSNLQTGTWLLRVASRADANPSWAAGTCSANCTIDLDFFNRPYHGFADNPDNRFSFNPEAIWRESYEGDWLYAYRSLSWDNIAASNIDGYDLNDFLNLSYKNSFFWHGIDTSINRNTSSAFNRKDITGTAWEGNTPLTNTYNDIEYMYSFTQNGPTISLWSDYFDGSVPNVPDDYSSWRNWTFIEGYSYVYSGTLPVDRITENVYSETIYTLPNFSLAENVLESGSKTGDRISYYRTWFNFVPLDSIRIVTYEITTETIDGIPQQIITLITASQGYTFYAGDVIQISEDAAINGQYAIYQVNSNIEFKVSLPGSTNTAGAIASTGIATKLPPAA
jgi:hypothetical protein